MMSRRNPEEERETPEQETPDTEEEQETPDNQEEQDDQQDQEQDQPDEQQEDTPADQEEEPQEQPPADPGADDTAALRRELIQAQSRLAAYTAGVAPNVIDDAVTLAMAEAARVGDVTEASVRTAMDAVLERHPEWKAQDGKSGKTGGFKLGADRDNGGTHKKPSGNQNVKRWNRFK